MNFAPAIQKKKNPTHLRPFTILFQPPQLPEPWNGARNFTELPSICIQNVGMGFMGEEDCLYLNVYTPAEVSIRKLTGKADFCVLFPGQNCLQSAHQR